MAAYCLDELHERLVRARIQLAMFQPFLASAAMRLPIKATEGVSWCSTVCTDGYHIFYNPAWVSKLNQQELFGVIAHEVLHVLFAHSERLQDRQPGRWNIACDLAVNLLLIEQGFELPKGGMVNDRYRSMSSEQIYEELPIDQELEESTFGVCSSPADEVFEADDLELYGGSSAGESSGVLVSTGADLVFPDHPSVKAHADDDAPDREALSALRDRLRADTASKLYGAVAAKFKQECAAADRSKVDWRGLLRSWLHDRVMTDWRSFPFSRKHLVRGLYLPSVGVDSPGHIVFAIDTSGSMTTKMLSDIVGELRAFRETFPCKLTVIQADAAIQSVTEYEAMDGTEVPKLLSIQGGGGTSFAPVFEWIAENSQDAQLPVLIYATDGYGSFWSGRPNWPIIWLLTERVVKVPHGYAMQL